MHESGTTVWTGVGAEPDHAQPPRLAQQLLDPGMQLRQEAKGQGAAHILIALQSCRVQHVAQLAQPRGVMQQALQHGLGDGVAAVAEGGELGAAAQGHEGALTPPCIIRKDPQVPHQRRKILPPVTTPISGDKAEDTRTVKILTI